MSTRLPLTRSRSVAVQELENETLIYDFEIDKAYCLNETSTVVYRHCDGVTTIEDLKRRYKYTDDLIYLALDELQASNLIEGGKSTHFAGVSRREAVRKVGLGTMFALPVVSGLIAPRAVNASSAGCAGGCNLPNASAACFNGSCQITACNQGFANCNGAQADGCETNLGTSAANCGGCGNNCFVPNGTAACVAGTCQVASCNPGFINCGAGGCRPAC